jgi:hypothetical protein
MKVLATQKNINYVWEKNLFHKKTFIVSKDLLLNIRGVVFVVTDKWQNNWLWCWWGQPEWRNFWWRQWWQQRGFENDDTDYEVSDNECGSEEDQSGISGDETDDFMGDDIGVKLKLHWKINGILADARRLVKLFCSPTVKNPILQKHVVKGIKTPTRLWDAVEFDRSHAWTLTKP